MASVLKSQALLPDKMDMRTDDDAEESEDFNMDFSEDGEDAKSETELELERAVFGDAAGFRSELKSFGRSDGSQKPSLESKSLEEEADASLVGLKDADLFFLDSGPETSTTALLAPNDQDTTDTLTKEIAKAVWHDPADEHLSISLLSQPRLRKLRTYEGEDVISGLEYQKRLRRQYELLHPRPKWADWTPSAESRARKRRRVTNDTGSASDSESEDEGSSDNDMDDIDVKPLDELLRSSASLLNTAQVTKSGIPKLRKEAVSLTRLKPFAPTQPHAVTCLSLHPALPILLSSGLSGNMYIHRIRNRPIPPEDANPLLTTMHFKNIPVATATFSPSPSESSPPTSTPTLVSNNNNANAMGLIHLSSRRRFMHALNLTTGTFTKLNRLQGHEHTQRTFEHFRPSPDGQYLALKGTTRKHKSGTVNLVSVTTGLVVQSIHIDAPSGKGVADLCWWSDSSGLSIVEASGEVSEFSLSKQALVARWKDAGSLGITTICVAPVQHLNSTRQRRQLIGPDTLTVLGATSGLVSIYARSDIPLNTSTTSTSNTSPSPPTPTKGINKNEDIKPLKLLKNLTTPISHLATSPDAQLLAISSRHKRDALRLLHLPSLSIYANWPTSKTPLGRVSSLVLGHVVEDDEHTLINNNNDKGMEKVNEKKLCLFVGSENGAVRGWVVNG